MNRIIQEYEDLKENPILNCGLYVFLLDQNIYEWIFTILGPKDTSYRGGIFLLKAIFPQNYPKQAPDVSFITPIYHLNVNPKFPIILGSENLGHICLSTLNWWKEEYKMREVLTNIFALFYMANPESPYGLDRAKEFLENRALYEKKIKYFTKKYANKISLIEGVFDDPSIPMKNRQLLEKELKNYIKIYETTEDWDFSFEEENKNKLNFNQKEIERLKSIEKDYISMKNLLNNYKDENNKLKRENNQIKNENYELKKQINELKMKSNNPNNKYQNINDNKDEIIALLKKIENKENEIKQIRQKIPYELKSGEELMPIIFISCDQKIHYAFICKNTDKFNTIENLLYEVYPEYEESENYFTVNGRKIIKSKTMQQNNIKPSSIIMLNRYED